jgi:deazaflavin-dependent oxidoreductase (nitroreductase family)
MTFEEMTMSFTRERPGPMLRRLFKVPLFLHRIGLGGMERIIGVRLMRLTTKGRRTGRNHTVMVDVLGHDEEEDTYYIGSAYGDRADWVRNIGANPVFEVEVGRRRFKARARRVPNPESSEMVSRYLDEHRFYAKGIAWMMGIDTKGMTDEELRSMFQTEMVLAVRPAPEDADIR